MQPQEQSTPPEEHEAIQYYVLEGLFPATHVFALNLALGTFLHLYQHAQVPYPLILGEQQLTERERDLLRPLLAHYPQFTPYEIIHASFYQGYDHLTEQRITQAQGRLDLLREEKLWDAELRPIRNVMARLRLKVREMGLDTIKRNKATSSGVKRNRALPFHNEGEKKEEEEQKDKSVENPGTRGAPLKANGRQHQRSTGEPQRR